MQENLLEVRNVTMQFGGLKAVDHLSFSIQPHELVGLIGPNGAGKTTAFNVITGVYQPIQGSVYFNGKDLTNLKPHEVCHLGMARTFQNIRLFKDLSVLDNLRIAGQGKAPYHLFDATLMTRRFWQQESLLKDFASHLLEFVGLQDKMNHLASALPYGEQRKLEIARALATQPKLLLLDEPAAGMNHAETASLMHTISKIRKDFNLTVLLIEHDMKLVMGICERILVLDYGIKIAEGSPSEIQNNPKVIEAYLGVDNEEAHP